MKMRNHRTGETYIVGGKNDPNYKYEGSSDMRMTHGFVHHTQYAIVSFPGVETDIWQALTVKAEMIKLMCDQGMGPSIQSMFAHDVIQGFLDKGTGQIISQGDISYCCVWTFDEPLRAHGRTYNSWFDLWKENVTQAIRAGMKLMVFTKRDGGLGNAQKQELAFLKRQGASVEMRNVSELDWLKASNNLPSFQAQRPT